MNIWPVMLDMFVILSAALLLGGLLERFKLSAIMGYMLAGLILGPGGIGFVEPGMVHHLSNLGVALLMFTIGLGFSLKNVIQLGRTGLGGGVLQITMTMAVVFAICLLIGIGWREAIVVGAMIPMTSTTCVLPVFIQRGELESVHGRHTIAISIMQDVSVVILALLVVGIGGEGTPVELLLNMLKLVMFAVAFILCSYVVFNYVLPVALDAASMTKNRELPIMLAVVGCMAAAWSANWLGLSPALGAFVAGMLLAESPFATQIRADVVALKTLFVTMFFTSIGMLSSLRWFVEYWDVLIWLLPAVIALKSGIVWGILRNLGMPHFHAMATGLCLSNVGEFAFILATLGQQSGILTPPIFEPLLLITFSTMALAPFTVHGAPLAGRLVERLMARFSPDGATPMIESEMAENDLHSLQGHIIVVGLGPAGQGVIDAMHSTGQKCAVIDLNPRSVRAARGKGLAAIVGDASSPDVLEHANLAGAAAMVIALPDHKTSLQTLRQARAMAPHVPVVVRARYHIHAGEYRVFGAHAVLDEESEIGRGLAAAVIQLALPAPFMGEEK